MIIGLKIYACCMIKPIADFFSIDNSYDNILVTLVLNIGVEKIDI